MPTRDMNDNVDGRAPAQFCPQSRMAVLMRHAVPAYNSSAWYSAPDSVSWRANSKWPVFILWMIRHKYVMYSTRIGITEIRTDIIYAEAL